MFTGIGHMVPTPVKSFSEVPLIKRRLPEENTATPGRLMQDIL